MEAIFHKTVQLVHVQLVTVLEASLDFDPGKFWFSLSPEDGLDLSEFYRHGN